MSPLGACGFESRPRHLVSALAERAASHRAEPELRCNARAREEAGIAVLIDDAILAVKGAAVVARTVDTAVKTLKVGWSQRSTKVKEQLESDVAKLRESLQHAGRLATLASEYSRAYEKVQALSELCNRANLFLRENMDSLAKRTAPEYESDWRVLELIFDGIRDNQDVPDLAALDRAKWYDDQDRAQIDLRLEDERRAYDKAADAVGRRAVRDVEREVKTMIDALSQVDLMLENSLYGKMFDALKALDGND